MQEITIPNTPYNELIKARHGTWCVQSADKFMARGLREIGECGEDETQLLCSIVSAGDTAIDCGANIGLRALPLAEKVGNRGFVFAFEPERINFLNLCANIAINSRYSAYPMNIACGAEHGEIVIPFVDPWQCDNIGLIDLRKGETTGKGFAIPVVPIDQFGLSPKLIKIDVEGMECEVLSGAIKTIERCLPYMFVECFDTNSMLRHVEIFKHLKYDGYYFESNLWQENNFSNINKNNFTGASSPNVLYVPKGKPVPEGFTLKHCIETGLKD